MSDFWAWLWELTWVLSIVLVPVIWMLVAQTRKETAENARDALRQANLESDPNYYVKIAKAEALEFRRQNPR